jgi:hypothetical protein
MTAITAAIGVMLLGVTTAAWAQPGPAENSERIRYSDVSKNGPARLPASETEWMPLASPTPASHGTEFVVIGDDHGPLAQLRIDADGKVLVRRVKVYFADGSSQVFAVDRLLDDKHQSATIALRAPQTIDQVVVTTEPNSKGAYTVYGSSTAVAAR